METVFRVPANLCSGLFARRFIKDKCENLHVADEKAIAMVPRGATRSAKHNKRRSKSHASGSINRKSTYKGAGISNMSRNTATNRRKKNAKKSWDAEKLFRGFGGKESVPAKSTSRVYGLGVGIIIGCD